MPPSYGIYVLTKSTYQTTSTIMFGDQLSTTAAFATPLHVCHTWRTANCLSSLKSRPLPTSRRPFSQTRMSHSQDDQPEKPQDPMNIFNMEVLRRRMTDLDERQKAGHEPSDQIVNLSNSEDGHDVHFEDTEKLVEEFERLGAVWVIVFTNTTDGSEGVYSLSIAGENIVLAFQDREEAQRYSFCLEAQKFPVPQICELDTSELREFCSEAGFRLGFVPKGSLISPPDESAIDDLDKWRPSGNNPSTGMSPEDIEIMKKRLDSLFGQ